MIKELVPIAAIVVIGGLEAVAIVNGIDGAALAAACTVIAGLGGYQVKSVRDRRRGQGPKGS